MSNAKVVMGQAANTLVKPLEVEDVFSTYLYTGTGAEQTITNDIDLDGDGGLVWIKDRTGTGYNALFDTERGFATDLGYPSYYKLESNGTNAQARLAYGFQSMNSDGFTIGYDNGAGTNGCDNNLGLNGNDFASWTFRKAPKFFDVVTYTGDGTNGRLVSHNLGSVPGAIIIKATSTTDSWPVYHRSLSYDNASWVQNMFLNTTGAEGGYGRFSPHASQTATHFSLYNGGNASGVTYVAYLFAHNDGDGGFNGGDIIKCGSYTGNGSTDGPEIDLGFEPQWVLVKSSTQTADWTMYDSMRGAVSGTTGSKYLHPNKSDAEATRGFSFFANGFQPRNTGTDSNTSGQTYIYIAIRRGTKVPESATEVFDVHKATTSSETINVGFPTDFSLFKATEISQEWFATPRLTTKNMHTNTTDAEEVNPYIQFDRQNQLTTSLGGTYGHWNWKRAPGFFDVVAYTGDGTTARSIPHNLGVAPEMMFHKRRNATNDWFVPDFINSKLLVLNSNLSAFDTSILANYYGSGNGSSGGAGSLVTPDASTFTVTPNANVNGSGDNYIAYLFASLPGISKVGSYTGNGTSQNIDCGFTSGARFVLIKVTSTADNWFVWDTARGISVGPDSYLRLDITNAETDGNDRLDPYSGGFAVRTNDTSVNKSGESYIFYAIA